MSGLWLRWKSKLRTALFATNIFTHADRAPAAGAAHVGAAAAANDETGPVFVADSPALGPAADLMAELDQFIKACNDAADYYCEKPGHVGPETVVDIYRTLASLAMLLSLRRPTDRLH